MKQVFKNFYTDRLLSNLIAITFLVCFSYGQANAQIEKGTIFLGTSTSVTSGEYDHMLGTTNSIGFSKSSIKWGDNNDDKEEYSVFNIAPKLGYFITNNLVLGANMKFWVQNQDEYKTSIWGIGPFARYYITNGKIVPFVEAEATFGSYKETWESSYSDGEDKESLTTLSLGGGVAFFINDYISIDGMIGYKTTNMKDSDSENDSEVTLNNFGFIIGFTVIF